VTDFARAEGAVIVVVDRAASRGVERGYIVDEKAIIVTPARQLKRDMPGAVDAFVHRVRRRMTARGVVQMEDNMVSLWRRNPKEGRSCNGLVRVA
jgi:hypothetical protein